MKLIIATALLFSSHAYGTCKLLLCTSEHAPRKCYTKTIKTVGRINVWRGYHAVSGCNYRKTAP